MMARILNHDGGRSKIRGVTNSTAVDRTKEKTVAVVESEIR